jgi:hypothetical protein
MVADKSASCHPPSAGAKFEVQLVPHDAREEEVLHGALDALVRLSDVANSIFDGITDRVREQRDQVHAARRRVEDAQRKIDALKGSQRATRVFSPAKFPEVAMFCMFSAHMVHARKHTHTHITCVSV